MFRHKYMKKLQLMIAIKVNSLTAISLRAHSKLTRLGFSNGTVTDSTFLRQQLHLQVRYTGITTTSLQILSYSHDHLTACNCPVWLCR